MIILQQIQDYLGDHKFRAGVLGGMLFSITFIIVLINRANKSKGR